MSESFRALCSDYYINQKLSVKMDLPRGRDTVLDLFERVRKQFPTMTSFRRYREELALESPQSDGTHRWIAVRSNNIRSGVVNPAEPADSYSLHKHILDAAPFFLNVSPLDVDYVELLYGFDLAAGGNHDAIVYEALLPGSPLAQLAELPGGVPVDCQPLLGMRLAGREDTEVYFEVKTRAGTSTGFRDADAPPEPISVYLTLRRFGSISEIKELSEILSSLSQLGEELVESRVVPTLLVPIRDAIASGS
ncbi:MAG: hypothetical protein KF805_06615 [Phycisphaeraceae bacterium]|nr:hypothetical protein [Phycisphaeraceae bacterium]